MIAGRVQQDYSNTKYYHFSTILEHVIDCFHTIVSDETNPYHPPLGWLTRKQPKPPDDELFSDLMDECSMKRQQHKQFNKTAIDNSSTNQSSINCNINNNGTCSSKRCNHSHHRNNHQIIHLSSSVRSRLERFSREKRKEITSRKRDGCSPLFVACQNGLTTIVKYLLDICDADIEQTGRFETIEDQHIHSVPPMWVAAVSGHYDTVKLLLDHGANVNSLSDTGSTPLRSVCFLCKDDDGSDILEARNCQSNINRTSGASSSHSRRACQPQFDIFSLDHSSSEDEDDSEDDDADPFNDDPFLRLVQLLVENGADVSRANHNGGTCLINSSHNYRLTKYILSHGAEVNAADTNGKTALHYAVQGNKLSVTKLLLAHGADPTLKTKSRDDALQLCCIGGHEEIFEYLTVNYRFSPQRLSDAYKLLGSSILELNYDIGLVRSIWEKSFRVFSENEAGVYRSDIQNSSEENQFGHQSEITKLRRLIAYDNNVHEFSNEQELRSLSGDNFRLQALLISERILGPTHRETIQRLLYRGSSYSNSMRPDRCVDLWIYALSSLIDEDSIFNFETFLGARAIKKLFLDLIGQQQAQFVKFDSVHQVLELLISNGRLEACVQSLSVRPRSPLHEDIFDLLLWMIVKLLLVASCVSENSLDEIKIDKLISELARVNPKASDGSSLLHVCATSSLFEGDAYRTMVRMMGEKVSQSDSEQAERERRYCSPVLKLIERILDAGLEVDQVNNSMLSPLQVFCLAGSSIRAEEKWLIIRLLVARGAHVDRRTSTQEQAMLVRLALRNSGIIQFSSMRLSCLAARQLSKYLQATMTKRAATNQSDSASEGEGKSLKVSLPKSLLKLVDMH